MVFFKTRTDFILQRVDKCLIMQVSKTGCPGEDLNVFWCAVNSYGEACMYLIFEVVSSKEAVLVLLNLSHYDMKQKAYI